MSISFTENILLRVWSVIHVNAFTFALDTSISTELMSGAKSQE